MNSPMKIIDELPLLDNLATAVVCLDDGLRVHYANSASEQLLGVSNSKTLGRRLGSLLRLPESLMARFREAIELGQPCTDRQVTLARHGYPDVLVDCHISPYRSEQINNGLLLELAAVDRPLRIARDEAMLTQQGHAQSLLRGLAHEIKNPLGGLRGAAQLLERQLPDEDLAEYTSIIIHEADRLQALIDRMLGPATRPQQRLVNIHEVLEHVRKIALADTAGDVDLRIDYDPSIPEFLSDRDRLVQVFLNIVGNAVIALSSVERPGIITFRSRVVSNYTIAARRHRLVARIEIIDNGPGIPDELRDQIFFPMVTGTDHGTGLGLSIAQSMMNQIHGLIECDSEPGHTVFSVMVPLEVA